MICGIIYTRTNFLRVLPVRFSVEDYTWVRKVGEVGFSELTFYVIQEPEDPDPTLIEIFSDKKWTRTGLKDYRSGSKDS